MNNAVVDYILEEKREKAEEFFINLFERCNLSCSFCWQDHDSVVGMDSIVARADDVIAVIAKKKHGCKSFDINVMGGELFFDDIPDQLFEHYYQFAAKIQAYAASVDVSVSFSWVSNLVFLKTQRVLDLMLKLHNAGINSFITTSYDPRGRFSFSTYQIFKDNLKVFKEHIRCVGVVMTKPNIMAILKGDHRLQELYSEYRLFFDYYSPEKNFSMMLPKDSELFEFFKYMVEHFPNAYPFKDWRENSYNKMTCRSSNVILPNGENGKCRALLSHEIYNGFYSEIDKQSNTNMESHFVEKRNCLTCDYFKRCGLGCFLQSNFKEHNDLNECLFYKTFQYIDENE